jgi:hypothetical protein
MTNVASTGRRCYLPYRRLGLADRVEIRGTTVTWHVIGNLAIDALGGIIGAFVLLSLAVARSTIVQLRRFSAADSLGAEIGRRQEELTRQQRHRIDLARQASAAGGVEEPDEARTALHGALSETDRDIGTIDADIDRLRTAIMTLEQRPTRGVSPYKPVLASLVAVVRTHLLLGMGIATFLTGILCGLQIAGVLPAMFT